MAIAAWKPGTIYIPGSLVTPTAVPGTANTVIPNADFESGDTDWTKGTGWLINTNLPFGGTNSAEYSGPGAAALVSATKHPVAPGKAITASCFVHQGASDDGQANAAVILEWYDSGDSLISTSTGTVVSTGTVGIWQKSQVSATAPPTAAKVSIGVSAYNDWAVLNVDNFAWNYVTGAAAQALAYKSVQAEAGTSGGSEPVWPTVAGNTVVDNEVTWEAIEVDSVTWEGSSILTSGSSEPTWPEESGAYVMDNNIAWEAVPLRIEDENCPHSKVVAIAASKVFAGDTDIVRFCATLNARDWTSDDDAGYLPTGLQQKSQVGVDAMGVYRGNLAIWSGSTFQVWQVDPDPAAMALLDAMEGIGSIHQQAVQPVSDDLFFLAALGVRTVSVAEGSNNLASGDVGVPIDVLVQAEANQPDVEPLATYYPGAGQYWLAFRPLTIAAGLLAGQFLLTSTLYPIEAVDGLQSSAITERAEIFHLVEDGFESSAEPMDSSLVVALVTHTAEEEAIETSATPLDSVLGSDIIEYTFEEAIETSATPLDSQLRVALITYTHPDEAIETSAEPQDSTLVTG